MAGGVSAACRAGHRTAGGSAAAPAVARPGARRSRGRRCGAGCRRAECGLPHGGAGHAPPAQRGVPRVGSGVDSPVHAQAIRRPGGCRTPGRAAAGRNQAQRRGRTPDHPMHQVRRGLIRCSLFNLPAGRKDAVPVAGAAAGRTGCGVTTAIEQGPHAPGSSHLADKGQWLSWFTPRVRRPCAARRQTAHQNPMHLYAGRPGQGRRRRGLTALPELAALIHPPVLKLSAG